MKAFDDKWAEEVRRKYERLPEYQRPSIYFLATTKNGRIMQTLIEGWLADLPEEIRGKLIPRLRAKDSSLNAFHDLIVLTVLKGQGFEAEYEKPLSGLTPDLYVHSGASTPAFIVEVLTDDISATQRERQNQLDDLHGRLSAIPYDVAI